MHDDKGVPFGILMTDAFGRPTADSIHYVNLGNSMAYGHAVGMFCLGVHLCGEKYLI